MRHTCEPHKQRLYDPRIEHDACGIGFVADIKGSKSHEIVQKAIQVGAKKNLGNAAALAPLRERS